MPLYEYKCVKCGRQTERIEKHSGPHLRKCPHCAGKVERMASAPAIQFKGSGWYINDYAKKPSGDDGAKSAPKDGAETKETKGAKETKEAVSKDAPKSASPAAKKK